MRLSPSQEETIATFLAQADVEDLHAAKQVHPNADLPQYFGRKRDGDNTPFVLAAKQMLESVGLKFEFDEFDSEARQLWAIFHQLPHRVGSRIADFERPFREMLSEIRDTERQKLNEQLKAERAASRREWREKYGKQCRSCGNKTTAVHPILDLLCCGSCCNKAPYKMIYRTTAKRDFGVNDDDLAQLPYAEVVNQHFRNGPRATLFLLADVVALAR